MEEFLDFLKEKLADIRLDASREHGMDAESEAEDYPHTNEDGAL